MKKSSYSLITIISICCIILTVVIIQFLIVDPSFDPFDHPMLQTPSSIIDAQLIALRENITSDHDKLNNRFVISTDEVSHYKDDESSKKIPLKNTKKLKEKQSNEQEAEPANVLERYRLNHHIKHGLYNMSNDAKLLNSEQKMKIAFAITMTADSGSTSGGTFHDGAAVLAYSIIRVIHGHLELYSLFSSISFVAFVHPSVTQSNRDLLTNLGYHVILSYTPVNSSAIDAVFLRERIDKNGCCGASELIKLNSYLLLKYDYVLHLDADTFFIGNNLIDAEENDRNTSDRNQYKVKQLMYFFQNLINRKNSRKNIENTDIERNFKSKNEDQKNNKMLNLNMNLNGYDMMHPGSVNINVKQLTLSEKQAIESIPYNDGEYYSLVYTTDPNMASHKGVDKMPVQGGFILFKPSILDYNAIIDVILHTPYYQGGAWNRSRIGWFWGGMTIQGVLPYYYNKVASHSSTATVNNSSYGDILPRSRIVDRCIYNSMADTKPCVSNKTIDDLVSAHFTVCQKPWNCWSKYWKGRESIEYNAFLCGSLHQQWMKLRIEAEYYYGMRKSMDTSKDRKLCAAGGKQHYYSMPLKHAKLPIHNSNSHEYFHFFPSIIEIDDSIDILFPSKYAGFRVPFEV